MIEFEIGSVPVAFAAKVMSKDATWVRAGIISGWLPIGVATRDGEKVKLRAYPRQILLRAWG